MGGAAFDAPRTVRFVLSGQVAAHVARRDMHLAQEHDHRGREVHAVALLGLEETVDRLRRVLAQALNVGVVLEAAVLEEIPPDGVRGVVRIALVLWQTGQDLVGGLLGELAQ